MAMIDYGSLVFKDGQQINWEMFMSLRDINVEDDYAIDNSGWTEHGTKELMEGNYFAFAGDNEFYIAAYKNIIKIVCNNVIEQYFQYPMNYNDERQLYYEQEIRTNGITIKIKSYNHGAVLDVEFNYKDTAWRIITGYGIDVDRSVFEKVWREYGITEELYNLIHTLWDESDKL